MLHNLNHHYVQPIRSFSKAARLFLLMTVMDGVIFSGWQLFFNFYVLQSGYSREFLGLVNSMPSAAALVFGILVGRISDRIGRKAAIIIGIAGSTVCMLAEITVRLPALIVVAAFFNGIFSSLYLVSQAPLLMKLSGEQNRTMLFSLNYGLQTISGAVGSVFAGQLPSLFGGMLGVAERSAAAYQAVLITSLAIGLSSLVPIWIMKEPPEAGLPEPATSRPGGRSLFAGVSQPLLALTARMTVPQVVIGFGAAILIPYMNVFFQDRFDISDANLGFLFSMSSLLIGVGSLVVPHLAMRLGGKIRAIIITQAASLVFLLLAGFAPTLWLSGLGYLLRAMLMNMAAPLYSAFCMERSPGQHHGFVNSFLNLSWNVGWAVGPYVSGVVQQRYGFTPLFISTALLYAVAIVFTWVFFRNSEREPAPYQSAVPAVEPAD